MWYTSVCLSHSHIHVAMFLEEHEVWIDFFFLLRGFPIVYLSTCNEILFCFLSSFFSGRDGAVMSYDNILGRSKKSGDQYIPR